MFSVEGFIHEEINITYDKISRNFLAKKAYKDCRNRTFAIFFLEIFANPHTHHLMLKQTTLNPHTLYTPFTPC